MDSVKPVQPKISKNASVSTIIHDYIKYRAYEDHDWVLRSKKLATKWVAVKKPQNNEDFSEDELISLYEKALKKG